MVSWHGQQGLSDLTADTVRSLLDYDPSTGVFKWKPAIYPDGRPNTRNVGKVAGTPNSNGYLRITIGQRSYKAHRLAWLYVHGENPPDCVDHINGDKGDNRIENLRIASHIENKRNVPVQRNNRTGLKGVTKHSQCAAKWIARIRGRDGVQRHLGIFNSPEEAAECYRKAALREHGEFAKF